MNQARQTPALAAPRRRQAIFDARRGTRRDLCDGFFRRSRWLNWRIFSRPCERDRWPKEVEYTDGTLGAERQQQPHDNHPPECEKPAAGELAAEDPLHEQHQQHQHAGLQRIVEQPVDGFFQGGMRIHFPSVFLSRRLSSAISSGESFRLSAKWANIGLSEPPKTRSRNDSLSAATQSFSATNGR